METKADEKLKNGLLEAERKETKWSIWLLVVVAIILVAGSFFFKFEDVSAVVKNAGALGPLVLILLKASTIVFAPISGSPLYPLSGALFGIGPGILYIFLGDLVGAVISFWISRHFGQKVVIRFLSKGNVAFLSTALEYIGTVKGLIITRVLFSPLPEVVSYAAGLSRLPFLTFISIHSAIGLIPTTLLVGFGASLASVTGPIGVIGILIVGSLAAVFGGWLFIKHIQPNLLQKQRHISATSKSPEEK